MKIAGWLGAVTRSRQRLVELKPRLLVLQFGGASGTLAALGEQAMPVAEALAAELQLTCPNNPGTPSVIAWWSSPGAGPDRRQPRQVGP
jgi:3-carboxy-cis,cis-muconate cycloisomerase